MSTFRLSYPPLRGSSLLHTRTLPFRPKRVQNFSSTTRTSRQQPRLVNNSWPTCELYLYSSHISISSFIRMTICLACETRSISTRTNLSKCKATMQDWQAIQVLQARGACSRCCGLLLGHLCAAAQHSQDALFGAEFLFEALCIPSSALLLGRPVDQLHALGCGKGECTKSVLHVMMAS